MKFDTSFLIINTKEKESQSKHLHVLRVGTNAVNQLSGLDLTSANLVDCCEEWELVLHVLSLEHVVHFFGGDWTLLMINVS